MQRVLTLWSSDKVCWEFFVSGWWRKEVGTTRICLHTSSNFNTSRTCTMGAICRQRRWQDLHKFFCFSCPSDDILVALTCCNILPMCMIRSSHLIETNKLWFSSALSVVPCSSEYLRAICGFWHTPRTAWEGQWNQLCGVNHLYPSRLIANMAILTFIGYNLTQANILISLF